MYIETSYPRVPGDNAILQSPAFYPASGSCFLRFFYSMYGATIGSLIVRLHKMKSNQRVVLFNQTGDHGNQWLQASFPINSTEEFHIEFLGIRGASYTSDIAIDDISFTPGCPNMKPIQKPPPKETADCTFENDQMCGWTNDYFNDINWQITYGRTLSFGTGPTADHTFENSTGRYIYVEGSFTNNLDRARLASPYLHSTNKNCKMVFYYHMYGTSIGSLTIYTRTSELTGDYTQVSKYIEPL